MIVSLIISVYKRADFLEKVLASVLHQSRMPEEVIICEDGQSSEIRQIVQHWGPRLSTSVLHITQEDIGNRKTLCVNKGIAKASGDYIVTIDGDCVLHKDFIVQHILHSDVNHFLTGRRVELSEKASELLTSDQIERGYLNGTPVALFLDAITGDTHHLGRFFMTPKFLRRILTQNEIHDIRGCNFSVHKEHLVAVNGYNNEFSGAYGEDSDLEYRLRNLGLKMKSVKGAAIQYHLWHKEQMHDPENQEKLKETLQKKIIEAPNGLKEATLKN
ncbi:glycosyltransferase [bacterium]|nr:glycosyltransferase [bacterium]